ncbi:pheromone-binding protein Gp-9-like [Odontomachus brunneus]|uniref:pheromone-binding protein Gp-9-like n=1 Tax=Odontomachus brunneus TaxID=486640 RepID=UPI0013F186EF|nr:pheromone-binding protein Gp-9-like [Odontomachus brunneus]
MKVLAFCACVLALVCFSSAETTGQRLKQALSLESNFDNCLEENDITQEDLYTEPNIINEEYKQAGNEERKRKNGCVFECIMKKEGLMVGSDIKEGKVHEQINRQMANNPNVGKVHKMARDCMREVKNISDVECEKGFSLLVCLMKAAHKEKNHGEHEHEHEHEHV